MSRLILQNARLWTGEAAGSSGGTVAIESGRLVYAGSAGGFDQREPGAIDLEGRLVVPGLWDSHAHLVYTGTAMSQVALKGAASISDVQRRVAARVATASPGEWIEGAGWDQNEWDDVRFPSRRALDAVSPDNPVVLVHTSGHCSWVNSATLRVAAIDGTTPAPDGGAIEFDDAGEPTGMLFDRAMEMVAACVPSRTGRQRIDDARRAIAHAHALGVTGVHAMDVGRGELETLNRLHAAGELRLRVRVFLSARDPAIWDGHATGDGDDWLRICGVKWFADGALGSLTAWMYEPYEGTDSCGFPLQPVADLEESVRRALDRGLAPAIHAIGDRANGEVLDLFERVRGIRPDLPRRIEHAQLLGPGMAERMASLDVTASAQPIHATQDMAKVDRSWGARGRFAYPFRTLRESGVNLAFGSDTPVETMDPLAGIRAAVMRQRDDGTPPEGWYPAERLTVEAALQGYTSGPVIAIREGGMAGRIARGYAADYTVLSHDIVRDPGSLAAARVEMTIVGGAIVYARPGTRFEEYAAAAAGAGL